MKFTPVLATTALIASIILPSAWAQDKKTHQFSDWTLGTTVQGDAVDAKLAKGKVVVMEFWGVRCPPCIASLPEMAKLDRRYRDDGLLLIGVESQNHSKEQMQAVLKRARVEYTITRGARGPVAVNGIPRVMVYDRAGGLVFDGSPFDKDFERKVRDAVREDAPEEDKPEEEDKPAAILIEERSWTNLEGAEMKAAVKQVTGDKVTFLMNGRSIDFPLNKLSQDSRKVIEEALKKAE